MSGDGKRPMVPGQPNTLYDIYDTVRATSAAFDVLSRIEDAPAAHDRTGVACLWLERRGKDPLTIRHIKDNKPFAWSVANLMADQILFEANRRHALSRARTDR